MINTLHRQILTNYPASSARKTDGGAFNDLHVTCKAVKNFFASERNTSFRQIIA